MTERVNRYDEPIPLNFDEQDPPSLLDEEPEETPEDDEDEHGS